MYEKYEHSLKLVDACIQVCEDRVAVSKAWDDLFLYIHSNFVHPQTENWNCERSNKCHEEVNMVRPFIDGTYGKPGWELEAMIRSIPPAIAEVVWQVAVARYLLRDIQVEFRHSEVTTFHEFYTRYGFMILGC